MFSQLFPYYSLRLFLHLIMLSPIFIVGVLITFLLSLFLSIPVRQKKIGSFIDPSFTGLQVIKWQEIKYHLLAGIGNAVSTIGWLYLGFINYG